MPWVAHIFYGRFSELGSTCDVRFRPQPRGCSAPRSCTGATRPRTRLMLGILPDEAALVAAEEMVAANKTVKEAMADEQHIIDVADSDSDDSDGASSDGFPEEEEGPEEAAFQEIDERDQAIMYQHTVDDAVFEAVEELADDDPVLCGVCEGGGHTDLLLLCDGQDLQKFGPRQGLKKRKPEQKCAVACHTFCCSPPL